MRIRLLLVALLTLLASGSAGAAPYFALVWSGTSGSGTTGDAAIAAAGNDVLTLDVVVVIDAEGFHSAVFDLLGTSGLTAAANSLVSGAGGPPECPSPPNLLPGTCVSTTFKAFTPIQRGVVDSGSNTLDYDMYAASGEVVPSTLTIGRGVFIVSPGAGLQSVSLGLNGSPGGGSLTDATFFSFSSDATATIVPEPGSVALLGLGLLALAALRRRR